ncbi:hypothetical protein K7432_003759 [Basidiobolus ranarum]|uniref:Uncharacterized protein n=1 Tax=Basidiobolus ranarum TaxID=34480 RepID=A0ABR2WZE2_9FUNG
MIQKSYNQLAVYPPITNTMFIRTVALAFAFCGLALGLGSEFSIDCGSSAQKCSKNISIGTRSCSVSGSVVSCRDQNVQCQYQGWKNYDNCKSCSLITCSNY